MVINIICFAIIIFMLCCLLFVIVMCALNEKHVNIDNEEFFRQHLAAGQETFYQFTQSHKKHKKHEKVNWKKEGF